MTSHPHGHIFYYLECYFLGPRKRRKTVQKSKRCEGGGGDGQCGGSG